jgi:hypothetical protein
MQATVRRGQKGIPSCRFPAHLEPRRAPAWVRVRAPLVRVRDECRTTLPSFHRVREGHVARCHLVPERFAPSAAVQVRSGSRSSSDTSRRTS